MVPCYDERATIATVVEQVLASPWTSEVIVVDDGSTDGTREVLAGLRHPSVRVVLQPRNQGKGAALRRGFAEARGEYVVVQDADLEYDPADYGDLVQPLVDGLADVVYGSRFISSRPHRVLYYWHSVGNRFLTTLSNMVTNLNLTDMETCYKAFRREVIQGVTLEEDRFGFEPEVTAKVARAGWRIYEVGIGYNGRTYAEGKKIGWRDGVRAVVCILKYSGLADRAARWPGRPVGRGAGAPAVGSRPPAALRVDGGAGGGPGSAAPVPDPTVAAPPGAVAVGAGPDGGPPGVAAPGPARSGRA